MYGAVPTGWFAEIQQIQVELLLAGRHPGGGLRRAAATATRYDQRDCSDQRQYKSAWKHV
jgi:hypothetical protein